MAEPATQVPAALDLPPSGRMADGRHLFPLRVYYEDTDAGGIVYHAAYLRFAERARTEMMRVSGLSHGALIADHGVMLAVHRCSLDYHRPARLDDALVVASRIAGSSGATISVEQQIRRPDAAGEGFVNLVDVTLRLVTLDRELRPARLPRALRAVLSQNHPIH